MNENEELYKKYNRYGDSKFGWQRDCINHIQHSKNVILSSPTGSGKTKVFLEWAQKQNGSPIIITAPIKALSNQRYRELLAKGYTVGLETGDIKNVPENCDFICCTQEIYTNKYAELENVTLIMDEFHYIFENSDRARTYVDALRNSKAENILLCSATLGDIDKLTEYVNRVSERDFLNYENEARATSLFFEGDIKANEIKEAFIVTFSKKNIESILSALSSLRKEQSKKTLKIIQALAEVDGIENHELLEYAKKGIAGYYGALLPKEKLFIEKCLEQGMIDTVVGTDALALGVNFPVKNVVFSQLAKYYEGPISKNLFEQLAGRAGRKGYYDEGHVYYCSDFANSLEAEGYNTERLFKKLLKKQNEDMYIRLTPNIKDILLGKTTIGEEAEFISEFSTEEVGVEDTFKRIENTIHYIMNSAFEREVDRIVDERLGYEEEMYYYEEEEEYNEEDWENVEERRSVREALLSKKEEFVQNIASVYFDEYSPRRNCEIFADIVCGTQPEEVLEKYGVSGSFYDMLQFRKYVKSLPKQYRKGLTEMDDRIREIDETAIDGFRGSVSVHEISEQLEREGRYIGRNIMKTLKDQEAMQKRQERIDRIEEQLRLVEQYGLEDYE